MPVNHIYQNLAQDENVQLTDMTAEKVEQEVKKSPCYRELERKIEAYKPL